MNSEGRRLRSEIISDINQIITHLGDASTLARKQKGVGCEYCADKLDAIAKRYKGYISRLNRLD